MSQIRANKVQVPTNSDSFTNLTADLATMADTSNVVIRVASQAERDALTKVAGLCVVRTDLPGCPIETCDGTNWSTQQIVKFWSANPLNGSSSGLLSLLQSGGIIPILIVESVVVTPDSNGYATITYPQAFPNGVFGVGAWNGDNAATGKQYMVNMGNNGAGNLGHAYININANGTPWTSACRITYIAAGW